MSSQSPEKHSPGATSWAVGSKSTFMKSLKDEYTWLSSIRSNHVAMGEFYTRATKKFFLRYGWELPYDKDADDGAIDVFFVITTVYIYTKCL